MFWGVTLETGKRYSQVVDSSYHMSMAALEPLPAENHGSKFVSVMIEHNKSEFLLCTLEQNRVLQVHLDHCFVEGEEVTFFLNGEGTVHLTGYIITDEGEDVDSDENEGLSDLAIRRMALRAKQLQGVADGDDDDDEDDDDDAEDDDYVPVAKKMIANPSMKNNISPKLKGVTEDKGQAHKRSNDVKVSPDNERRSQAKKDHAKKSSKHPENNPSIDSENKSQLKKEALNKTVFVEDTTDDEEDEDFLVGDVDEEDDDDSENTGSSEESGEWVDADDDEVEMHMSPVKKPKLNGEPKRAVKSPFENSPKVESPQNNSQAKNQDNQSAKKKKQKNKEVTPQRKTPEQKNFPEESKSSSEGTPGGSKPRKSFGGVELRDLIVGNGPVAKPGKMVHVYYRGTLPNKSEFDSCTKGKPFSFRLGRSEVIKGWDVGIQGMKVGGKRKLVVPPAMGYGNKASGPIPPNSSLHFEVELKAVS